MDLLECPKDGFPLLPIHGRLRCVAEYMDACIGGHAITDVVRQEDTIYYVFDNDHKLPLLCFCCGQPLACEDLAYEKKNMVGRRFEAMSMGEEVWDDGRRVTKFLLEFTPKAVIGRKVEVVVSLSVAEAMIHPAGCKRASRPR